MLDRVNMVLGKLRRPSPKAEKPHREANDDAQASRPRHRAFQPIRSQEDIQRDEAKGRRRISNGALFWPRDGAHFRNRPSPQAGVVL